MPLFLFKMRFLNRFLNFQVPHRLFASEAELLDLFHPKEPVYTKEVARSLNQEIPSENNFEKKQLKKQDVVISCNRPEFNHYRNQKYDKLKPIPLASKGWHHYKSKGDFFTIKIFDEKYDIDNHFWEENVKSFSDLKLNDLLIQALEKSGFHRPTKIQADSIPVALTGKNTLIAAETGCGKTLAYLIPIIEQVLKWKQLDNNRKPNTPLALILTPSRELALQIYSVAKELSHYLPIFCNVLIGGKVKRQMLFPEFKDVDIQISTLGAMSKLTTTGIYNVEEIKHVVLDESDTLLDDSFSEQMLRYIKKLKIRYKYDPSSGSGCQLILASATFPKNVDNCLADIVEVSSVERVISKNLHRFLPHVPQTFHRLGSTEKPLKLLHLAKKALNNREPTIIFSNRSQTCDWVSLMLNENGIKAMNLNGEMPFIVRKGKYNEFLNGQYYILSCTDIASRGLDTRHVKHVINYDFPLYMADYIHRSGRTGRCGSPKDCLVTNFVSGIREVDVVNKIEMAVRTMEALPNVNANITNIIRKNIEKKTVK